MGLHEHTRGRHHKHYTFGIANRLRVAIARSSSTILMVRVEPCCACIVRLFVALHSSDAFFFNAPIQAVAVAVVAVSFVVDFSL